MNGFIEVMPTVGPKLTFTFNKYQLERSKSDYPVCFDCLHFFKNAWRPAVAGVLFLAGLTVTLLGVGVGLTGTLGFGLGIVITAGPGLGLFASGCALIFAANAVLSGGNRDEQIKFTAKTYTLFDSPEFVVFDDDFEEVDRLGYLPKEKPMGDYPDLKDFYAIWNWNRRDGYTPNFFRAPQGVSLATHKFSEHTGWIKKMQEELDQDLRVEAERWETRTRAQAQEKLATTPSGFVATLKRLLFQSTPAPQRITENDRSNFVLHDDAVHPVAPAIADRLGSYTKGTRTAPPVTRIQTVFNAAGIGVDRGAGVFEK